MNKSKIRNKVDAFTERHAHSEGGMAVDLLDFVWGIYCGRLPVFDCEECGEPFPRKRSDQRFCCPACKELFFNRKRQEKRRKK